MDIIILGKNSDDKGTQLESLTAAILKNKGYEDISTNEILAGGHEIDVSAEFAQPGLSSKISRLLLCECKAHKEPISTTEWMKFLGKIFINELGGKTVSGCFIALNGVNGNVRGQYRELKKHRDDIELITGDQLYQILKELYQLEPIERIQSEITSKTERNVLNTCICYYANNIYWAIVFTDNSYSLLTHRGQIVNAQDAKIIQPLLSLNTDWTTHVDLEKENLAKTRAKYIEKFLAAIFLIEGRKLTFSELFTLCTERHIDPNNKTFSESEVNSAVISLKEKGIVTTYRDNLFLKVLTSKSSSLDVVAMFRFYLSDFLFPIALGSRHYTKLINGVLLDEILRIQGDLPATKEDKSNWIKIIKWSPSALAWAIEPDPVFFGHRSNGQSMSDSIDHMDIVYFRQKLAFYFSQDFTNQALADYFYNNCEIKELETIQKTKLKGSKRLIIELDSSERIALLPLQTSDGVPAQIIGIKILEGQEEPWDNPALKKQK